MKDPVVMVGTGLVTYRPKAIALEEAGLQPGDRVPFGPAFFKMLAFDLAAAKAAAEVAKIFQPKENKP